MNEYNYRPTRPETGKFSLVIWATLVMIVILVVWASFAKIDQVTRATATVIASARTQEIQAVDEGVLSELLVKEGDDVKKGDLLAVLEKACQSCPR